MTHASTAVKERSVQLLFMDQNLKISSQFSAFIMEIKLLREQLLKMQIQWS